jgi:hypothetical protein
MKMQELQARFDWFKAPSNDLWTRKDGQRLIMTPSKYCVTEDLKSKLMKPLPHWFVVGRDERRMSAELRRTAKELSLQLSKQLMVDRSLLFGKQRTLLTRPIKKRDCQVSFASVFWKPKKLFCCYQTPKGSILYREVIGEK